MTEPGIYYDMPDPEYRAIEAFNVSKSGDGLRSMKHLKHRFETPRADTEAFKIGRAIDDGVQCREYFTERYAAMPNVDGRTKEGKAIKAELREKYAPDKILTSEEYTNVMNAIDAVYSTYPAKQIVESVDHWQTTGIWHHSCGVLCKGRTDGLSSRFNAIVDIKSTKDASYRAFRRSIANFGYYRQAAHYLDGFCKLGVDVSHFILVVVEKEPPHGVAVFQLSEDAIDVGRQELDQVIRDYKKCTETGIWPGYPEEVQEVSLPWLEKKEEQQSQLEEY